MPILGLKELIPRLLPTGADKNKIQISYRDAVRNIGELIMEISKETILIWAMWHVLMFYATDIYSTENEPVRRFLEYIGQGVSLDYGALLVPPIPHASGKSDGHHSAADRRLRKVIVLRLCQIFRPSVGSSEGGMSQRCFRPRRPTERVK